MCLWRLNMVTNHSEKNHKKSPPLCASWISTAMALISRSLRPWLRPAAYRSGVRKKDQKNVLFWPVNGCIWFSLSFLKCFVSTFSFWQMVPVFLEVMFNREFAFWEFSRLCRHLAEAQSDVFFGCRNGSHQTNCLVFEGLICFSCDVSSFLSLLKTFLRKIFFVLSKSWSMLEYLVAYQMTLIVHVICISLYLHSRSEFLWLKQMVRSGNRYGCIILLDLCTAKKTRNWVTLKPQDLRVTLGLKSSDRYSVSFFSSVSS